MSAEAWALGAFAAVGIQRLAEMGYARRTGRALARLGARAVRPDGYAAIVAVHVAWFALAAGEVYARGATTGWHTWVALAGFLVGQALRFTSMVVLGPRWSTRVWVLPAPLVARGPYRLLRHPIYVGVVLELLLLPALFGLWATALAILPAHLLALRHRVRLEERALGLRSQPSVSGSSMKTGSRSGDDA